MFIAAKKFNSVSCFVGLRNPVRTFEIGSKKISRLRDLAALGTLALLLMTPAMAQRNPARTTTPATQTTGDGLSASAKTSLDAAVAALQSNALADAERAARAAVTASQIGRASCRERV